MTAAALPEREPGPMVPLVSLKCEACRKADRASRRRESPGRLSIRGRRPAGCTCRRVWPPGHGPENPQDTPVGEPPMPATPPPATPPV